MKNIKKYSIFLLVAIMMINLFSINVSAKDSSYQNLSQKRTQTEINELKNVYKKTFSRTVSLY